MRRWRWTTASALTLLAMAGCTVVTEVPIDSESDAASPSAAAADDLVGRAAHTATATTPDTVLVAGGCVVDGCGQATTSAFIVAPDGHSRTASMQTARDAHVGVRLDDGTVLVVGGFSGEGQPPLASAETYDSTTRTWSAAGQLAVGRGGHAAALLGNRRALVVGGWIRPRTFTDTTEVFDPSSRRFTPGPRLPVPADGLTATSLDDGSVLVVGGQTRAGVATAQAALVDRDGGRAARVAPLATPRFKHAAVKLPSGEVLIIGGTTDDRTLLSTTEIYDPRTRTFRPGPTMSEGRYKLAGAAAALPDGRVVVAGSAPGLEIIDPEAFTSHTTTVAASLPSSFATVSLTGDRIRVIGGYDRSIRLSHSDLTIDPADL